MMGRPRRGGGGLYYPKGERVPLSSIDSRLETINDPARGPNAAISGYSDIENT
jgi:hypothetical protein